jgi:predicted outer membrane repeat protein
MAMVLLSAGASGAVFYVDDSAAGANNGSSWANAFISPQTALDVAISGDEIRVAQGIYKPTVPGGDRSISFAIHAAIMLKGGFAGFGAVDPDAWDPKQYTTVLSGDLNGDDIAVDDPVNLATEPTRQDNAYQVIDVLDYKTAKGTVVDGFVITGGRADGGTDMDGAGGGIVAAHCVTVRNCLIENNSAAWSGGGCWGAAELSSCTVRGNYAPSGGGIACADQVVDCVIEGNTALRGGGIMPGSVQAWPYGAEFRNCVIRQNHAKLGGGVYLSYSERAWFQGCTFEGNEAVEGGGGIYLAVDCTCTCFLWLYQCRIEQNRSGKSGGGLLQVGNCQVQMWSCLVNGNTSGTDGGGVCSQVGWGGLCQIANCTITSNTAGQRGGGLTRIWYGWDEYLSAANTIFWGNADSLGTGTADSQIYYAKYVPVDGGAPTAGEDGNRLPGQDVQYSCIQGWGPEFGGEGNIGDDPMFSPTMGPLPDYHLTAESPCINTGTNAVYLCVAGQPNPGSRTWVGPCDPTWSAGMTDLDGLPRICGGIVDMGAYEFQTPVGRIVYVDDSAPGMQDGSSWVDAFTDLQDALAVVGPDQKIHVAQGTYRPADPNGSREASFQLKNGVTIRGGFAGYGAVDPDLRDAKVFQTILSGDLSGTLPDDNLYSKLMDRGTQNYGNSLHVVAAIGVDASTVLEGVVITGGTANGFSSDGSSEGNTYRGGGVYVESASPTLIDCTITGNVAYGSWVAQGGGMYCVDSSPTLIRCSFVRNMAEDYYFNAYGAGMANDYSNPTLVNCLFEHNYTSDLGGGMANISHCRVDLRGCVFDGNSGQYGGGAVWGGEELSAQGCLFAGNRSGQDGGAIASVVRCNLSQCTFAGNFASDEGNALFLNSGKPSRIVNCILRDGGDEISPWQSPAISVSFSNVEWGWPGPGNIDVDPLFADAANGDYHLKSQAGRWDAVTKAWVQDTVTSPCIDAGDPGTPIMFESFPNGGVVNMGAYGGTAEASKSYFGKPVCEVIVAGDINGDCKVDLDDFAIMARHWLEIN